MLRSPSRWSSVVAPLAGLALMCGCAPDTAPEVEPDTLSGERLTESMAAPPTVHADYGEPHSEIGWFDGSVEQALARAAEENKPVFLYWGAEWCPPCHEVKATVFRSREFIERSRLFVPVYLDGDTDNAQAVGEKYGVLGYPTMIVLSADGEEITRIPGGSDIQAYANILDLTLGDIGTAAALLARVLEEGDAKLAPSECRLLAYYSWGQDTSLLAEDGRAAAFRAMYRACPEGEQAARTVLYMAFLTAAIDADGDDGSIDPARREEAALRVRRMLADMRLARANMYTVLFDGAKITAALTESHSEARQQMRSDWLAALAQIANDSSVFMTERLYALYGRLQFERIDNPETPPSAELKADILAAVDAADAGTRDPYERQSVINTARNVLVAAELREQAKKLLLKEIGISRQPYYFMVGLADIEQESGNYADAIGWLKRAWDESRGPATRFQWGTYYVTGLIEMAPEEVDMIESAALSLIAELGETSAFYQRPKRQLEGLEKRLRQWNENPRTAEAIGKIRAEALGICSRIPVHEASRATCEAFLADAATEGETFRG